MAEGTLYSRLAAERDYERIRQLVRILENVRGDVYLWRIGELTDAEALTALSESADEVPWWAHRYAAPEREEVSPASETGS